MSADALGSLSKLNKVAEALFEDLEQADQAQLIMTGIPMVPKNMEAFLEEMREQDLKVYREYQDCQQERGQQGGGCVLPLPKFHWDFRPRHER